MKIFEKQLLQKIIDTGLLAITVLMPISLSSALYSIEDPVHPIIAARFSIADVVIAFIFFVWLSKIVVHREYRDLKLPPVPIIAFVIACFLSGINASSMKNWLKELIQYTEYFIVLYLLLVNNTSSQKQVQKMIHLLFTISGLIVLVALYQHFILQGSPYLVRSLFENQHILGIFLSLCLPFMLGYALHSDQRLIKIFLYAIIVISVPVILSAGVMIALIISF